jgi:hypothetical protein
MAVVSLPNKSVLTRDPGLQIPAGLGFRPKPVRSTGWLGIYWLADVVSIAVVSLQVPVVSP